MAGKGKQANKWRMKKYKSKSKRQKARHSKEKRPQESPKKSYEEQRATLIRYPSEIKSSRKFLAENFTETYSEKTPAVVYGNSRKHISTTIYYVNKKGELPYVEIATEIMGSQLPPCKIKTLEKRLEFEAILMISEHECDVVRKSSIQELSVTYEAKQNTQIRDQLSAVERTFQDKIFNIKEHLSGECIPRYNNQIQAKI